MSVNMEDKGSRTVLVPAKKNTDFIQEMDVTLGLPNLDKVEVP